MIFSTILDLASSSSDRTWGLRASPLNQGWDLMLFRQILCCGSFSIILSKRSRKLKSKSKLWKIFQYEYTYCWYWKSSRDDKSRCLRCRLFFFLWFSITVSLFSSSAYSIYCYSATPSCVKKDTNCHASDGRLPGCLPNLWYATFKFFVHRSDW